RGGRQGGPVADPARTRDRGRRWPRSEGAADLARGSDGREREPRDRRSGSRRVRRGPSAVAAMARKERPHRSELAVPGTKERAMEKAPGLGADVVFLDLEDAVAPGDKERARANVIRMLLELDWSRCAVSVRVNSLDTH